MAIRSGEDQNLGESFSADRLHRQEWGQSTTGDPIFVLLHGLGVSGAVWTGFVRRHLSSYRVIAPDLRGHADSFHATYPVAYTLVDYATDVASLLHELVPRPATALPPTPIYLVGHSLGGLVAIEVARRWPALVQFLGLIDPPLDVGNGRGVVENVARLRLAPPPALEDFVTEYHGAVIGAALSQLFRRANDGVFSAYLATPPGVASTWEAAPHIDAPTVLVQADPTTDGALGDHVAQAFVSRLSQGRHCKVTGAAHAVHASHPRETRDALLALLTTVPRPSGPSASA